MEVRDREALSLTCTAVGNPQPVVIWKRSDLAVQSGDAVQVSTARRRCPPVGLGAGGESRGGTATRLHAAGERALATAPRSPEPRWPPVTLQVRNGTLSIAVVERASAGTYTCHASSKEGTITHTTRVLVQGRSGAARRALAASRGFVALSPGPHCPLRPHAAGPPVIVVPPQNVTVNISQDAFLACQAEAYPGNLTYTWFQGSSNVFHLRYGGDVVLGVAPGWPQAPGGCLSRTEARGPC